VTEWIPEIGFANIWNPHWTRFSSFCGRFLPYFISFLSYIVAPLGKIMKYVKNLAKNEEKP